MLSPVTTADDLVARSAHNVQKGGLIIHLAFEGLSEI